MIPRLPFRRPSTTDNSHKRPAPASRPYPGKREEREALLSTTPDIALAILPCVARPSPASQVVVASYRSSLQPHRPPIWAFCSTHLTRVGRQTARRKRVAVCAAKRLHLASAVSRSRTKLLHIGPPPHSAGLRACLRLSLRVRPSTRLECPASQTFISTATHDRVLHSSLPALKRRRFSFWFEGFGSYPAGSFSWEILQAVVIQQPVGHSTVPSKRD